MIKIPTKIIFKKKKTKIYLNKKINNPNKKNKKKKIKATFFSVKNNKKQYQIISIVQI